MRTLVLATATLAALGLPALAQSDLDRLEAGSEAAGYNMERFMVSRVPELADVMIEIEWDEEMRAAGQCTLDLIREEGGDSALSDYIAAIDHFGTIEFTSMEHVISATPVPISPEFAASAGETCGSTAIATRRMQESGLMEAMMDPAIMARLMGG